MRKCAYIDHHGLIKHPLSCRAAQACAADLMLSLAKPKGEFLLEIVARNRFRIEFAYEPSGSASRA